MTDTPEEPQPHDEQPGAHGAESGHHLRDEIHKIEDEVYVDSVNWGQTITWIILAVILIGIGIAGWIWLI